MRYKTRLAFRQELAEHLIGFLANATLHQKTCKVGAGDQFRIADKFQGTFIGSRDTDLGQSIGHLHGPLFAPTPGASKPFMQLVVIGIKAQTHDMHRLANKRNRYLYTGEKLQAVRLGCQGSALNSADFVMVSQRPELYAVGAGTRCKFFRCECAVRDNGVAVQIGVKNGSHPRILGAALQHSLCAQKSAGQLKVIGVPVPGCLNASSWACNSSLLDCEAMAWGA